MRAARQFLTRFFNSATRRHEERFSEEIEEHLRFLTAENIRAGLSPDEARRQAILKFGSIEAIKEGCRDQQRLPLLENMLLDVCLALRRLRMAPTFTMATVLTLALGIGATTSIFTLVHAVLMKSLPVTNPAELLRLGRGTHCCYVGGYSQEDDEFSLVSYDLYKYLRDNTKGFSELAAVPSIEHLFGVRRSGGEEAAQGFPGEFVSGNYFVMFGIRPYVGRMFTSDDDQPGAKPVAVMSYRLWHEKYGSSPSVIGSVFNIDEKPVTVIGVTPPGFFGDTLRPSPPDFFLPLNTEPYVETDADLDKVDTHWLDLIGRVQPGAVPALMEAQMRVELKQWLDSHAADMSANERAKLPKQTLYLSPGGAGITSMREQYKNWLKVLMAVSGFVLLIVCANVANLMLVRGMERRREVSLSMALGAQVSRLVSQPLTESILLSLFGGLAGLAIAFALTRLILYLAFPSFAGFASLPISASPSMPVLLFALVTSLLTGLAFGMAPAWAATRVHPIDALRGTSRLSERKSSFSRKTLVVLQTALSLVLLSVAGLLTSVLRGLEHQNLGFEQDHRFVATMNPKFAGYRPGQLSALYRSIHDAIAEIPGVSSVALCLYSPQNGGGWGTGVWVDGHAEPGPMDDNSASWNRVTVGYLDLLGTPIVRGRDISELDTATSRKIAVINEAFARRFFRNEDPLGKHFGKGAADRSEFEIVGIAKDARNLTYNLAQPVEPFFFQPEAQAEYSETNLGSLFLKDIVILTRPEDQVSVRQIRQAMASVDPNLPIISVRTLREQVASQFDQQRLAARFTSFFGILALGLASIGLYGVTAYNAGRRVNEIGIRMALGADPRSVVTLILRGAFLLIVWGLLSGVPLALVAIRVLKTQLYGVSLYDEKVTLTAVVVLALSGLTAALIPAWRASSISPAEALRSD
jgi:predicted permease